jgi:hypothetical protein
MSDLHINITLTEEVIRLFCTTVGFAVLCWAAVKIIGIIGSQSKDKNGEN